MHDSRHAIDIAEGFARIVAARGRGAVEPDRASNGDAGLALASPQCVARGSK